jgi:hypothetical protein
MLDRHALPSLLKEYREISFGLLRLQRVWRRLPASSSRLTARRHGLRAERTEVDLHGRVQAPLTNRTDMSNFLDSAGKFSGKRYRIRFTANAARPWPGSDLNDVPMPELRPNPYRHERTFLLVRIPIASGPHR